MAVYDATQIPELTTRVLDLYKRLEETNTNNTDNKCFSTRLIITLAGVPGSGKSTVAQKLCNSLNHTVNTKLLPQDGYHYYRLELAQFENPEQAFERRGAPFTFNARRFLDTIKRLKSPQSMSESIFVPSFDHRLKDPIEDDIEITPETKIVLIEGNYVSLQDPIWNEISQYADETWLVQADHEVLLDRIIKRHLQAGIAANLEEAKSRAQGSDQLNADYIKLNSKEVDVIINN